ncbi:hypothetical protein [Paenibacillus tundrae]
MQTELPKETTPIYDRDRSHGVCSLLSIVIREKGTRPTMSWRVPFSYRSPDVA